jgi:hypothetical protein
MPKCSASPPRPPSGDDLEGAGGFRRSKLVGLDHADIERVRQGMVISLRRSKTDQEGAGRKVGIPFGRTRHCPVIALDNWLSASGIDHGPVFRSVDRRGRVASERLSGEAVSLIVKKRVAAAGIKAAPCAHRQRRRREGQANMK